MGGYVYFLYIHILYNIQILRHESVLHYLDGLCGGLGLICSCWIQQSSVAGVLIQLLCIAGAVNNIEAVWLGCYPPLFNDC